MGSISDDPDSTLVGAGLGGGGAMVAGTAICGRCGISLGLRPRRWREAAAVGACIGAAGQAIVLGREYSGNPSGLVSSWWELVFAVVIALSALVAVQSEGRPLSWRTIVPIAITGAAIAAYPAVIAATTNVTSFPDGSSTSSSPFFGISGVLDYGLLAAGGIAVLVTIGRCRPEAPLTPLAVFTAGLFWLRRHERFLSALSAK